MIAAKDYVAVYCLPDASYAFCRVIAFSLTAALVVLRDGSVVSASSRPGFKGLTVPVSEGHRADMSKVFRKALSIPDDAKIYPHVLTVAP